MAGHGPTAAADVVARLGRQRATLALAESVTGGRLAASITDVPGTSEVLAGGVVAYTVAAKVGVLGVEQATIDERGVVSEAVAREMAERAIAHFGATWALATTGYAGPTGGTVEAPIGTVWLAVAHASGTSAREIHVDGDREAVRAVAVDRALALLLERMDADAPADQRAR